MAATRPKLLLIDGYSNFFRAFYAIRNLSSSKGEPTNAVYGFVTMLRKLLREQAPDYVGVALDVGEKTFRSEQYSDYKANRRPMPEDLVPQLPWLRRVLEAYRIPILEAARFEADDVLGTLGRKAAAAGFDVVLVTADKDLFQLVAPHVSLYHTGRERLYDPPAVAADFGVPPEKVVDVLALMGDPIDNVPGVPGIGEKGAKQLVREYGDLETLLRRTGELQRKAYREGLQQHRDQALLSKQLVTVRTDLPIELDAEALRAAPPDTDALRELWRELEFFSLLDELGAASGSPGVGAAAAEIDAPVDGAAWSAAAREAPRRFSAALAGSPAVGVALAWETAAGPKALWGDFRLSGIRAAATNFLAERAADPQTQLVGHDLKEVLRTIGTLHPGAGLTDTLLMSFLLRTALGGHSLDAVVLDRLGLSVLAAKDVGLERDVAPLPGDAGLAAYAAEQATLPLRLAAVLEPELAAQPHLHRVYTDIEAPLLPVLLRMEEAGVALDREVLAAMSIELGGSIAALEREIFELAGESFHIASPQKLGAILFEKLQYPVLGRTRKTKSYSTDAETLEELATRGYPLAEKVLRHRELCKLKSNYVDGLPPLLGSDGRLHTRYNQAGAATGRLSSSNPNLQNIPVRSDLGLRIRRAFRAAPGARLLVADYNQIELRVLAHIADEDALVESFRAGVDIHRSTAATVFGVAPELVTPDQRRAAKVINFGILYGMSAFGLAKNLGIPTAEADRFIKAYLERFPKVRGYVEETAAMARRDGRVETLYGRIRQLPDIQSKNFALRENARRMAINARIQGTAADLLKMAMIAVDRRLTAERSATRLLLTVHDELVLEAPQDEAETAARWVRDEMEGVAALRVPLAVDVGVGETWFDAKR